LEPLGVAAGIAGAQPAPAIPAAKPPAASIPLRREGAAEKEDGGVM